ncbi:MAG: hypothetical protein ACRDJF_02425, partial [Actinomycetota bacterium]
ARASRGSEEGRFAASWQNKAAGRALRAARMSSPDGGTKQSTFAAALSEQLGIPISPTTLSGWETGRRTVPAPVWMAAALVSKQSLDALLGEAGAPEVVTWAQSLGLPGRFEAQATEMRDLKDEVRQLRQQYASLYTQMVDAFTRAGLPRPTQARPGVGHGPSHEATGTD